MAREQADLPLLKSQENEVFRLIQAVGMDPADFEWGVIRPRAGEPTVAALRHPSSGYFFAFGFLGASFPGFNDRISYFRPGPDRGGNVSQESLGWEGQREVFIRWLQSLSSELGTVSLWDTLASTAARELALATLPSRGLSKEQQAAVADRIGQVRIFLRGEVSDRDTMKRIEAKLDYLVESSKRLGVKDFANVALGVLVTLGVEAALDPTKAQQMVNLFTHGLRALLGG